MPMSNYLENKLLDATLRNTSYTSPATVYMALYSTVNTATTAGTELSGNGYSRQAITFGTAAASGSISSTANVSFTASGGNWSAAVSSAIVDASSGGNVLYYYNGPARTVLDGETLTFESGDITVIIG
jgi:hypothetical protein